MRRGLKYLIAFSISAFAACGAPSPLDEMAKGESGIVVRVFDGDALLLDSDLSVRLVGLEAPAGAYRDRPAAPGADLSTRILEDLALGRRVQQYYPGLTRDRYDRALAHIVAIDDQGPNHWINVEMARLGAALARAYPDTSTGGEALRDAETEARRTERGLWANGVFAEIEGARLAPETRGFVLITGRVERRLSPEDGRSSCTLKLANADLVVDIDRAAAPACRFTGDISVRGYVREGRLRLTALLNIDALGANTNPG